MQYAINELLEYLQELVIMAPPFVGLLIGMIIIVLESMIPALPLGIFIAINMLLFGNITGFIASWIATCIGCLLMFFLVRKFFRKYFEKKFLKNKKIKKLMKNFDNIQLPTLVLITALPFTPAFLINIASGLSEMSKRKFIANILVSKIAVIYFWGFVGTTFVESVTDIKVLIKLALILTTTYIISKIVMKKNKID